jgi:phosphatidylserine/phosphatidylglycerophosphate/cardiolipin synthase-like enzyme
MHSVLTPLEYLEEALREIDNASESVLIQTMNFEAGEKIGRLEDHLKKAAQRGVNVHVNYDWVAKRYVHGDLRLVTPVSRKRRRYENSIKQMNFDMYARLQDAGVKLTLTNSTRFPLTLVPFTGRSHIKMLVIDSKTAWIGGLNMYDGAFENLDFMVRTQKPKMVSAISDQFFKVNKNKHKRDYEVVVDEKESVYVDVGKKRKSIIYDTALKNVREASSDIIYMSAFVPDSKLLEEMMLASLRNIRITVIASHEGSSVFNNYPDKLSYIYFKNAIKNKPNIKFMHIDCDIHGKLIIVDKQVALYGSHNYTYSGVLFGTAEIMVETREEEIISEFLELLKNNVKELELSAL